MIFQHVCGEAVWEALPDAPNIRASTLGEIYLIARDFDAAMAAALRWQLDRGVLTRDELRAFAATPSSDLGALGDLGGESPPPPKGGGDA